MKIVSDNVQRQNCCCILPNVSHLIYLLVYFAGKQSLKVFFFCLPFSTCHHLNYKKVFPFAKAFYLLLLFFLGPLELPQPREVSP